MKKRTLKPGNLLAPVPAALISCRDAAGNDNLITLAWVGTVCSTPPMLSVSIRPERHSYQMIRETGEFAVNLTTEAMARMTDLCGVRSGRDTDKWELSGLHRQAASVISCPIVEESPVSLECRVTQVIPLGSHDMFLAEIVAVDAAEDLFDETDRMDLGKAGLIAYVHGAYQSLGRTLGTFGYSVRKKKKAGRPGFKKQ